MAPLPRGKHSEPDQASSQGTESPALKTIQVFFPRESWEQYLPAIYRSGGDPNSFLSRYLAIFQTIYGEMEEKLQNSGRLLDSRCVDGELLSWLAGWLDVGNVHIWPEERLRSFLLQAVDLYKLRGTREGILRTAELYTGSPAWLVEYQELLSLLSDSEKRESWERLYGVDKSVSFLLLKEEALPGQEQYRAFQCILDDMRPARIQVKVILLKSFLILGGHSYLGINSRLERLRPMMLDGTAHLPFTALKNNGQDMEE